MKPFRATFSAALLAALLAACKGGAPDLPPLSKDEISGARLWKRIAVETDFDAYPEWPGYEGLRIGQSPHGRYHEIYINKTLRGALPIAGKRAPTGSVIVKENFDAEKALSGFTVMAKVEGFDPERNDWFWASYGPDGTVKAAGKAGMCISCHEGLASNDYVIVRPLDEPLGEGHE